VALAGVEDLMDLGRQVLADARQLGDVLTSLDQGADVLPQAAQDVCTVAVGADAERVVASISSRLAISSNTAAMSSLCTGMGFSPSRR